MIPTTLLESIDELSVHDKLALIEAITQMLQHDLALNGTAKPQNGTNGENFTVSPTAQQNIQALIAELLSRPTPPPEKMLRRGMFQGRIPVDEEIFKLAEWHPTDEELTSG